MRTTTITVAAAAVPGTIYSALSAGYADSIIKKAWLDDKKSIAPHLLDVDSCYVIPTADVLSVLVRNFGVKSIMPVSANAQMIVYAVTVASTWLSSHGVSCGDEPAPVGELNACDHACGC